MYKVKKKINLIFLTLINQNFFQNLKYYIDIIFDFNFDFF